MSLTTVTVSIDIEQCSGAPLPNARVDFELTSIDIDGAIVVPHLVSATCNAIGIGSVSLWANANGSQGTQYKVTVYDQYGVFVFSALATVPASNCDLHAILTTPAPATVSDAQAAANAAQASAALAKLWAVQTDAEVVPGQGYGAKKYALDAAASAASADTDAATATMQAQTATTKASEASASASTATTKASEAAAQANAAASSAASAASVLQQDLSAISAQLHASPNAIVALFPYDTSKDSDGGAWIERCQNTSWYQEALNGTWLGAHASEAAARAVSGATTGDYFQNSTDGKFYKLNGGSGTTETFRGNKRKFPRLAAIVAEAASVTIYDLTEPGRPMWMRFVAGGTAGANYTLIGSASGATTATLAALNGVLCVGYNGTTCPSLPTINFAKDSTAIYRGPNAGRFYTFSGNIAQRNSQLGHQIVSSVQLVNDTVNAVAMTVLPDAPVDPVTGLQVPTIAVGTAGGASIIQNSGAVVNSFNTSTFATVDIDRRGTLVLGIGVAGSYFLWASNIGSLGASFALNSANAGTAPDWIIAGQAVSLKATGLASFARAVANGVSLLRRHDTYANGLAAQIRDTYNTGWMTGDIRRCLLADTGAGTVAGTELVTNGTFDTDTTGWTPNGTVSYSVVAGVLNVESTGGGPAGLYQDIPTVAGQTYILSGSGTGSLGLYGGAAFTPIITTVAAVSTPVTFVALGATTRLYAYANAATGVRTLDNISIKAVIADRSYKAKPATVYGTLTKTAVASAAQLMFFGGWSATNYAQEAYSSDLDFGTGDWSASAPVSIPVFANSTAYLNTLTPTGASLTHEAVQLTPLTGTAVNNGDGTWTVTNGGLLRFLFPLASLKNGSGYEVTLGVNAVSGGNGGSDWADAESLTFSTIGTKTYRGARAAYDATFRFVDVVAVAGATVTVTAPTIKELVNPIIVDRSAASGAYWRLGLNGVNQLFAEAYDGTTTRRVTSTAAYNTTTPLKVRANYQTSGTLSLQVNGETVASTTGAPLLTLNNASAVLTIGNSRALDAPFPGSIALLKIGATVPTDEQSKFMWAQESRMFQAGAQVCLPDSTAVVDMAYDDGLDVLTAKQAANMSQFHGLVRVASAAPSAGSFTKTATRGGVRLAARSTTNPGVDVTIPAYGLREELVNRSEAAARLARSSVDLDYVGGFTADTTNGSTSLTSAAGLSYPAQTTIVGATITGSGIPASTVVTGVSGTTVYMSKAATATATGVSITFTDFVLPTGMEAVAVLTDGAAKQEGSTKAYTRRFDGFRETIRYAVAPGVSAWVQIKARRTS